uniref:Uncharacterized protein n=1 Tax=Graphocephala atropunctata TaxID=36148 RepID=A0A1B6M6E6_9HEMI
MAFQTISQLDSKIVEDITSSWNGHPPANILKELKEDSPWAVIYTTDGTYINVMKHVGLDDTATVVFDTKGKPNIKKFNWSENNGVLTDGTIQCYVIVLEAGAFAYYICDTQGPPGPAQGAVAIALGPPGGIPNEYFYTASCAKRSMKKMNIKLNIKCDINVPSTYQWSST